MLVRVWHGNEISCIQFLRGGRVRVTVRDPAFREELLSSDFVYVYFVFVFVMVMSTPFVMRVLRIFLTCVMVTICC